MSYCVISIIGITVFNVHAKKITPVLILLSHVPQNIAPSHGMRRMILQFPVHRTFIFPHFESELSSSDSVVLVVLIFLNNKKSQWHSTYHVLGRIGEISVCLELPVHHSFSRLAWLLLWWIMGTVILKGKIFQAPFLPLVVVFLNKFASEFWRRSPGHLLVFCNLDICLQATQKRTNLFSSTSGFFLQKTTTTLFCSDNEGKHNF